jgi:hypothetical protein
VGQSRRILFTQVLEDIRKKEEEQEGRGKRMSCYP